MFKMNAISEDKGWIMIEFTDDSGSAASFTINKEEKTIKITAPNRKGAFEWKIIQQLEFKSNQEDSGELIVHFGDEISGTDDGELAIGYINKNIWKRIVQKLMGEVEVSCTPLHGLLAAGFAEH